MSESKFDDELNGKGVLTQDGREIGKISDLVVDHDAWKVTSVVVKLDRDLLEQFDMKKPMFGTHAVALPVSFVSGVGDKLVLHKKLEDVVDHAKGEGDGDGDEESE